MGRPGNIFPIQPGVSHKFLQKLNSPPVVPALQKGTDLIELQFHRRQTGLGRHSRQFIRIGSAANKRKFQKFADTVFPVFRIAGCGPLFRKSPGGDPILMSLCHLAERLVIHRQNNVIFRHILNLCRLFFRHFSVRFSRVGHRRTSQPGDNQSQQKGAYDPAADQNQTPATGSTSAAVSAAGASAGFPKAFSRMRFSSFCCNSRSRSSRALV